MFILLVSGPDFILKTQHQIKRETDFNIVLGVVMYICNSCLSSVYPAFLVDSAQMQVLATLGEYKRINNMNNSRNSQNNNNC